MSPFGGSVTRLGLYLQKKYQETIDALEPAMASIHAPELVCEAQFLLGSSKLESKQPEAAAKALEAALAADPKWRRADETRLALAAAYRQAGQLDQAQANLRRLIADFPPVRCWTRPTTAWASAAISPATIAARRRRTRR